MQKKFEVVISRKFPTGCSFDLHICSFFRHRVDFCVKIRKNTISKILEVIVETKGVGCRTQNGVPNENFTFSEKNGSKS